MGPHFLFSGGAPDIEYTTGELYQQSFYGCFHSMSITEALLVPYGDTRTTNVDPAKQALPGSAVDAQTECSALTRPPRYEK